MALLIQTEKVNDTNKGELKVLDFLSQLPDEYIVIRELKIAYQLRKKGQFQKTPDFVVLSEKIGLIIIEVKDWDLNSNFYYAKNQYKFIRENKSTGDKKEIENPYDQTKKYKDVMLELLKNHQINCSVEAYVAFPTNSKNDFILSTNSSQKDSPNNRFIFNDDLTLFKDSFSTYRNKPESLLEKLPFLLSPHRIPLSKSEINKIKIFLIPDKFLIGDFNQRAKYREELALLSGKQMRWVFSSKKAENFLFDLPGSGKTNCIISKALHLCEITDFKINILISTYSDNLINDIKSKIKNKFFDSENEIKYLDCIRLLTLKEIFSIILEQSSLDIMDDSELDAYRELVIEEIKKGKYIPKIFDYALIDEIQDFNTADLRIIKSLMREDKFFFVGDIGQKLLKKTFDLKKIGLLSSNVQLPKSYVMYRTPYKISRLAVEFILNDLSVKQEFLDHNYNLDKITFNNNYESIAEINKSDNLEADIVNLINKLLTQSYTLNDILIVSHTDNTQKIYDLLSNLKFECSLDRYVENKIIIANFFSAKGLEKPCVIIIGIELLLDKSSKSLLLKDIDTKLSTDSLSRKQIYIALTRATERVFIFYTMLNNSLISELIKLNTKNI